MEKAAGAEEEKDAAIKTPQAREKQRGASGEARRNDGEKAELGDDDYADISVTNASEGPKAAVGSMPEPSRKEEGGQCARQALPWSSVCA